MIQSWSPKSLARGKAIYNSLCVNCHGTVDEPGSLPNAWRFAAGKFRSAADPYSMYQTLTHGFGMMLPQPQLVPLQEYDVIYYIREAYLQPHQPSQYTLVDAAYLASLPKGTHRGPAAIKNEPWREMDYGPFLISSYELVGPESPPRPELTAADHERAAIEGRPAERTWPSDTNFAYKGIAIKLDEAPGGVAAGSHWIAFDHDTLRIAGAWTGEGFIDWNGILFDGQHFRTPRTVGTLQFANPPGPGWAHGETGSFDDIVPHEQVDGWWQGGMCRLPLPDFPTGLMRARFHPRSGHLYVCGMQAWGSSQIESPGGLYRAHDWKTSELADWVARPSTRFDDYLQRSSSCCRCNRPWKLLSRKLGFAADVGLWVGSIRRKSIVGQVGHAIVRLASSNLAD